MTGRVTASMTPGSFHNNSQSDKSMKLLFSQSLLFIPLLYAGPDLGGEELVNRYLNQASRKSAVLTMSALYREPGTEPVLLEFVWMRKSKAGRMSHLIRIESPPSEKGKLLLVKETGSGQAEYIAYRPSSALKKKVRVSGARNYKYKTLTISVQELIGGEFGKYTHQLKGEEVVNGVACHRVESLLLPQFQSDSNYRRLFCFLRKDNGMLWKWELFGKSGQLEKIIQIVEIKPLQGFLTVTQAEVQDLKRKGELKLSLKDGRYNVELKDDLFSEDYLKQNSR